MGTKKASDGGTICFCLRLAERERKKKGGKVGQKRSSREEEVRRWCVPVPERPVRWDMTGMRLPHRNKWNDPPSWSQRCKGVYRPAETLWSPST